MANSKLIDVAEMYLKRRGFINDAAELTEERLVSSSKQSTQKKILLETVGTSFSRMNNILFSSSSNSDVSLVDNQFIRMMNWISDISHRSWKQELKNILCPLFCHLYCEMLQGGFQQQAVMFRMKHEALFLSNEEFLKIHADLKEVLAYKDIQTKPLVMKFRSSKYHLKFSSAAMVALQNYLSTCHVVLMQVIRKWFDFEILPPSCDYETEGEEILELPKPCKNENGCDFSLLSSLVTNDSESVTKKPLNEIDELKKIQKEISIVDMKIALPGPISIYTIANSYRRIQCARLGESPKQLAFGHEKEVRIWNLGITRSVKSRLTRINLDSFQPEEDSQEECSETSVRLGGHMNLVQDVCFLRDRRLLLSVSQDGDMRAWDLTSNTCAAIYRGHISPVWCVATSSLNEHIATGSQDRTVKLWNLDRLNPLRSLSRHTQDVECIGFHPNGLYMASGSTDKTVRMFDINTANEVRILLGHKCAVQSLAFSPNGKLLATGGENKSIRVWDLGSAVCIAELNGHAGPVASLSWSSNSEQLASCDLNGKLFIWNVLSSVSELHSSYRSSNPILCQYDLKNSTPVTVQHTKSGNVACIRLTDEFVGLNLNEEKEVFHTTNDME